MFNIIVALQSIASQYLSNELAPNESYYIHVCCKWVEVKVYRPTVTVSAVVSVPECVY